MQTALSRHLETLEAFLRRDGAAPSWSGILLVKDADISHGPKMTIADRAIHSPEDFAETFQGFVDSGCGWINLVGNGIYRGKLLVSVEVCRESSDLPPEDVPVNVSGPYSGPEGNKLWDLSDRLTVTKHPLGKLNQRLVPSLLVRSIEETLAFYEKLGFAVSSCHPDEDAATWVEVERDGVALQFHSEPPCGTPAEPACTGTFYFFPQSVAALAEEFRGKVEFAWGPEVMDYGLREFAVKDPNGYYLAFAEPA